ncbi:hypothetical protein [Citrobacter freundii]|uniref:hypothetical protein n=1 Tax=Citrobacter freundii TaxID=546 RepID=UPI0027C792E6|nr:hypothetical protein [Citrobacter freundii]MDQ2467302.1 hypothetical protein [Citrobacter freundii]
MSKVISFPSRTPSFEDVLGESLAADMIDQLMSEADSYPCPVIEITSYSLKLPIIYKAFSHLPQVKIKSFTLTQLDANRTALSNSLKA